MWAMILHKTESNNDFNKQQNHLTLLADPKSKIKRSWRETKENREQLCLDIVLTFTFWLYNVLYDWPLGTAL